MERLRTGSTGAGDRLGPGLTQMPVSTRQPSSTATMTLAFSCQQAAASQALADVSGLPYTEVYGMASVDSER